MYLLDGHVHLQSPEIFEEMLDTSLSNMKRACPANLSGKALRGGMLLAELPGKGWCRDIFHMAQQGKVFQGENRWRLQPTRERDAVLCSSKDGDELHCILGSQVNSLEKIEVLLFGVEPPGVGLPVREIIRSASQKGALVILPWGVGKWLGKRGKMISSLLEESIGLSFYVGDNGNRPKLWSGGVHFAQASAKNIPIIRGTDPLGLPGEVDRIGSFGNIIHEHINADSPLQGIQTIFRENPSRIDHYGRLQPFFRFLLTQLRLRIVKQAGS